MVHPLRASLKVTGIRSDESRAGTSHALFSKISGSESQVNSSSRVLN